MAEGMDNPGIASALFGATLAATAVGIFLTIYFLFISPNLAYRIAAAILVGVTGVLSFVRHSVFYRSDQARMGWRQDHPGFQLEVGYANLATGLVALLVSALDWGTRACGMMLLVYGIYLLCTLILHVYEAVHVRENRSRAARSVTYSGIFVIVLLTFALMALSGTPAGSL